MSLQSQIARFVGAAMAMVVGLTLAAPPALAAPAQPLATAAAVKVAALPAAALAPATAGPQAPAGTTARAGDAPGPKPFLKTTRGALAVALLAGAAGYTFYSFSHDRVKSPAK